MKIYNEIPKNLNNDSNKNKAYSNFRGDYVAKKKTSISLDTDLLKELKRKAIDLDTTQTELMEKYIKEGLANEKS